MGDFNHHNTDYENRGYSSEVPVRTGDRRYAQDSVRDLQYLRDLIGSALGNIAGQMPVIISGGEVTQGSGDTLDITACVGYVKFEVDVINAFGSPPTVKQVKLNGVETRSTQQTNLAIAGATLDGATVNYVKLKYSEADGNTRSRAKASGSYAYERVPSFTIVVNSTPTLSDGTEIQLDTFVGASGGTFVFSGERTSVLSFGVGSASALVDMRQKNHVEKLGGFNALSLIGSVNESYASGFKNSGVLVTDYTSTQIQIDIAFSHGKELQAPAILQIYDGTNSALLYITGNTGTVVSTGYQYKCVAVGQSFLASASTVTNSGLSVESKSGRLNSSLTGTAKDLSYDIKTVIISRKVSGYVSWSYRWNEEKIVVHSFPTTGSIEVSSGYDNSANFPSGSKIRIFKRAFTGFRYDDTLDAMWQSNYIDLDVTGATYSSGTQRVTITHSGSNANDGFGGTQGNEYIVVKNNSAFMFRKSGDALAELEPESIRTAEDMILSLFEDFFNRADSNTVGNDWGEDQSSTTTVRILGNELDMYRTNLLQGAFRSLEGYTATHIPFGIEVRLKFPVTAGGSVCEWFIGDTGGANTSLSTVANSLGVAFAVDTRNLTLYYNTSTITTATSVLSASLDDDIRAKLEFFPNRIRAKAWNNTTGGEPATWDIDYSQTAKWNIGGTNAKITWGGTNTGGLYVQYTYFGKYAIEPGFISEGITPDFNSIESYSGGLKVSRDDSAEDPEMNQYETNLVEA
jgi:hypothetical protein